MTFADQYMGQKERNLGLKILKLNKLKPKVENHLKVGY